MNKKIRDLALFNLAIDSKLRSCDLVKLKVRDVSHGAELLKRAMVMQQKTSLPVQFEITAQTRESLKNWIEHRNLKQEDYLFPSRSKKGDHISTRQYGRALKKWVADIGLSLNDYGTHSLRRTKAALYTKELKISAVKVVQLEFLVRAIRHNRLMLQYV